MKSGTADAKGVVGSRAQDDTQMKQTQTTGPNIVNGPVKPLSKGAKVKQEVAEDENAAGKVDEKSVHDEQEQIEKTTTEVKQELQEEQKLHQQQVDEVKRLQEEEKLRQQKSDLEATKTTKVDQDVIGHNDNNNKGMADDTTVEEHAGDAKVQGDNDQAKSIADEKQEMLANAHDDATKQ